VVQAGTDAAGFVSLQIGAMTTGSSSTTVPWTARACGWAARPGEKGLCGALCSCRLSAWQVGWGFSSRLGFLSVRRP